MQSPPVVGVPCVVVPSTDVVVSTADTVSADAPVESGFASSSDPVAPVPEVLAVPIAGTASSAPGQPAPHNAIAKRMIC